MSIVRDHSTVHEDEDEAAAAAGEERGGFFLPRPSWTGGLVVIAPQEETAAEPPPEETMIAEMMACLGVDDVLQRREDPSSNEEDGNSSLASLGHVRDHDPTAVGHDSEEDFIKSQCKKALRRLSSFSNFFNNDDLSAPASSTQWNRSMRSVYENNSLQDEGTFNQEFNEMDIVERTYPFALEQDIGKRWEVWRWCFCNRKKPFVSALRYFSTLLRVRLTQYRRFFCPCTDIEEGRLLGRGGYSTVREMRRKVSSNSLSEMRRKVSSKSLSEMRRKLSSNSLGQCHLSSSNDLREMRQKLSRNSLGQCVLSSSNDLREEDLIFHENCSQYTDEDTTIYAIKRLRNDLRGETKVSGAIDLTVEAQFLSKLSHSHIVNLHGTRGEPGSANFYIIIDRVQSNLSDGITVFRRQRERLKLVGICRNGVRLDKKGKAAELKNDFDRRVDITRQVASALQYLHEHS